MRSEVAIGAAVALLIGAGGLLPASAAAEGATAPETLREITAAAHKRVTAEPARQADLVSGEDQRLIDAQLGGQKTPKHAAATYPYRTRSAGFDTLVLTHRRTAYTLDDLRKLAPQTLVPQGDDGYLLREHILVGAGATLSIAPRRPLTIRMSSGPEGFVSLVALGGRIRLKGTAAAPITFQSWDESKGRPDSDLADGRAYVRVSGQLVAEHTAFEKLGFWSGRTGGLSLVGSGVALGSDVDAAARAEAKAAGEPVARPGAGQTEVLPAGKLPSAAQDPALSYGSQIINSTMTGNAFGVFVTGSSGPTISRTVIRKSLVDGLVLHGDVASATVSDVQVELSGADGVDISREVEGAVLTRLDVSRNGGDGIVLAGRPLARGPSASGASIRSFGNNTLTASKSSGNLKIGIHVIGGTAVRVQGNTVNGGQAGIVVAEGAEDIDVDSNQVAGAASNGIQVRESSRVRVTGNGVRDSPTGIHVRNSVADLRQNSTTGVSLHGITFVGRVAGSSAEENRLAGSGTTAIDLVRAESRERPKVQQNDLSAWSRTVTSDSLLSVLLHPLTVIWMLVALMLLAMSRPKRGGGGRPYRVDPLEGSAPMAPSVISVELPTESAISVSVRPEYRAASPSRPAPLGPPSGPPPVPVLTPRSPVGRTPDRAIAPKPLRPPVQPAPPARVDHAVIDLSVREARLNPAVLRRRRVNGR